MINTALGPTGKLLFKLIFWSSKTTDGVPPDDVASGNAYIRFVPLCNCRERILDYAKIIYEPDGPHFDVDVFEKLKDTYWRSRWHISRKILKFWLFDLKEVRPVTVETFTIYMQV